ncbi:unnamed protein product [Brugia timori]|uniref:Cytochrome C-type biogenesis protein n=1 Tax=Brugia timori TaxID=42155 RepID=A0A0R3QNQ0_9BILA|nr:unnamed protein product [Brugia timori]
MEYRSSPILNIQGQLVPAQTMFDVIRYQNFLLQKKVF